MKGEWFLVGSYLIGLMVSCDFFGRFRIPCFSWSELLGATSFGGHFRGVLVSVTGWRLSDGSGFILLYSLFWFGFGWFAFRNPRVLGVLRNRRDWIYL